MFILLYKFEFSSIAKGKQQVIVDGKILPAICSRIHDISNRQHRKIVVWLNTIEKLFKLHRVRVLKHAAERINRLNIINYFELRR